MASMSELSLESVRDSLIRQEDSIVFALIERAKFPLNSKAYNEPLETCGGLSLVEFFVREAEALQAKGGRYQSPEENPFFPDNLPSPLLPPYNYPQALSRRIHFGKHVAEVKFREAPQDYTPLIHAQDNDALMKLLTFTKVEEMVKKRVAKKAMVFGKNVTLEDEVNNSDEGKCKVNPCIVSSLYGDWIMPLTKIVEVRYLLRRLEK